MGVSQFYQQISVSHLLLMISTDKSPNMQCQVGFKCLFSILCLYRNVVKVKNIVNIVKTINIDAKNVKVYLMTNFLTALSLGHALEQLLHRMNLTWPRPCLLRPLLRRLDVMMSETNYVDFSCTFTRDCNFILHFEPT